MPYVYQGNLVLSPTNVKSFPDNLTINGDLYLNHNNAQEIPKNITVSGDIYLSEMIDGVPQGLNVLGNIYLNGQKLESINNAIIQYPHQGNLELNKTTVYSNGTAVTSAGEMNDHQQVNQNAPSKPISAEDLFTEYYFSDDNPQIPIGSSNEHTVWGKLTIDENLIEYSKAAKTRQEQLAAIRSVDETKDFLLTNKNIKQLPKACIINKNLVLGFTDTKFMPKEISVNGNMRLQNLDETRKCGLKELPQKMKISGLADLTFSKIEKLPADFTVAGNLYLNGSQIKELSSGTVVRGNIDASNSHLGAIKEGFKAHGDLILNDSGIKYLPKSLVVMGNLQMNNTNKMRTWPQDLQVGSNFVLHNSNTIRYLPEKLLVAGNCVIKTPYIEKMPKEMSVGEYYSTNSRILPNNLTVAKDLYMEKKLANLPKNTKINGNIFLNGQKIDKLADALETKPLFYVCVWQKDSLYPDSNKKFLGTAEECKKYIAEHPDLAKEGSVLTREFSDYKKILVQGDLNLQESSTNKLTKNITVQGNINLSNSQIKEISDGFDSGKSIDLSYSKIQKLPETFCVNGNLLMDGTNNMKTWPDSLVVNGSFSATDVKSISNLPKQMIVAGNCDIKADSISSMPEYLRVNGNLTIDSADLPRLPATLNVKGSCNLENTGIRRLPPDFSVGKDLYLNTKIISLPPRAKIPGNIYMNGQKVTHISQLVESKPLYTVCVWSKGCPFPDINKKFEGTIEECQDFVTRNQFLFEQGTLLACRGGDCYAKFVSVNNETYMQLVDGIEKLEQQQDLETEKQETESIIDKTEKKIDDYGLEER